MRVDVKIMLESQKRLMRRFQDEGGDPILSAEEAMEREAAIEIALEEREEKEEQKVETLLNMTLHEQKHVGHGKSALRVPGGWVYQYVDEDGNALCFVPEPVYPIIEISPI